MTVPKSRILAELRRRAQHDRADWVDRTLPEQIDTGRNSGVLSLLAIDMTDLPEDDAVADADADQR
ncbi:hypothetical protein [Dactylosporangium sp. NPDC049140]|uniref:hypothetical protein n=1 Tax=Dactylosporangium sp. NPDC049140 TaxID=3155647 RepID=UPI0033F73073